MNPAILDSTTIDVKAGTYLFRATGSVIKFDGFRRIYMEGEDDTAVDETIRVKRDVSLPVLKEGDKLDLRKLEPKQHFTQPPPRYNEATLVKRWRRERSGGRAPTPLFCQLFSASM